MTIRSSRRYDQNSINTILQQVVDAVNAGALALQEDVDATAVEINYLHSVTPGTTSASKALVVGASKNVDELRIDTTFKLGATAVTASAAELNLIDGSVAGTSVASKAAVLGANKDLDELRVETTFKLGATAVLATAAELNRAADVSTRVVAINTSTAIAEATHEGKTLVMGGAGSARTHTLPAATGGGARYRFFVGAVNTSNYLINTTGNDVFYGNILAVSTGDTPDLGQPWTTAADSNTITLDGTTTGGVKVGDWVEVEDIAADTWAVRGIVTASGTEATPFSNV